MADMQPISNEDIAKADAAGNAFISDRFRINDSSASFTPPANYTFAGICAIIAFIAFVIALLIVIQDWKFLTLA